MCVKEWINLILLQKIMKSVMFSCYAPKVSFFIFHSLIRHMLCCIWFFCFVLINFCNINVLEIKLENCRKVKQNGRSILYFSWRLLLLLSCFSRVWLLATPWTVAHQAPLSMGFSRQEYWSGVPLPSPSRRLAHIYFKNQNRSFVWYIIIHG